MENLAVFLPPDRRAALLSGAALPDRMHGAVMFADVSGFTPLAEALAQELGPRRGAEELTALLNRVYSALITQVEQFGGSVVGFSGDAITCWFDDAGDGGWGIGDGSNAQSPIPHPPSPAALRALAAALAMRRAIGDFAAIPTPSGHSVALMVKTAVAAGPIRRFLIGDPQIQVLEVLAGGTLDRLSAVAHLAERDDVVTDAATLAQIEAPLQVASWRRNAETRQPAAVITELPHAVAPAPWPDILADRLQGDLLRPWVLPAVYARLQYSANSFLAELRPAVALMVQFGGLKYDNDETAGMKLDAYIRRVQAIVTRYEGHVVDITLADKGGYLFATFGALHAHEDDAWRAALTALELRAIRVTPEGEAPRIGMSLGLMRTGLYGGATRRTYGVLGDHVNLACRLMSAAMPGQILVSVQAQQALVGKFEWAALPNIRVKGKRTPVAIYQLVAEAPAPVAAPNQARGQARLVGRDAERAVLNDAVTRLLRGTSGAIVINGEPGIGKSRLLAELAQILHTRGIVTLSGSGHTIERTSYSAWRAIFGAYFGLDQQHTRAERYARVEEHFLALAPQLRDRLPLLNDLLNLRLNDTDFTQSLDTAERGEQLVAMLAELLRAEATRQPLAVLLDDAQLLDSRSLELAVRAAQACVGLGDGGSGAAMLIVVALRSVEASHPAMPQINHLLAQRGARRIVLSALGEPEIVALTATKLGIAPVDLPAEVAELVQARASGNPLFAEELIQALRDDGAILVETVQEVDQRRPRCVVGEHFRHSSQKLPDTLQGLILGRIDRLAPSERLTLRVASAIGPTFEHQLLHAIRNKQTTIDEPTLKNQLRALAAQDFIWLEEPEPHLAYRFKHILTQEAAYQSLLYAQRREIHSVIADWYEQTYGGFEFSVLNAEPDQPATESSEPRAQNFRLVPYVALLAHHCHLAEDTERERLYVALLGEQAANISAFQEAIACFERAVLLTPSDNFAERGRLAARLGRTYIFLGDLGTAERYYRDSIELAGAGADLAGEAGASLELGALAQRRKAYPSALELLDRSLALYRTDGDRRGEARVLDRLGGIYIELGEEAKALECYRRALALGRNGRARQRGGS